MIEIKKTKSDNYKFFVKSETGKVLLKSILFADETSLKETLGSLSGGPSLSKRFERKTNFNGQFLFELKNQQGKLIGKSGLYSSEAGMENGIKNLNNRLQNQIIVKSSTS
ncbi:MAG: hypothetical protein ACJAU2_000400 [Maribacter sp.]|jgi:uncharacterized protein YegP (UPF0339 family)